MPKEPTDGSPKLIEAKLLPVKRLVVGIVKKVDEVKEVGAKVVGNPILDENIGDIP